MPAWMSLQKEKFIHQNKPNKSLDMELGASLLVAPLLDQKRLRNALLLVSNNTISKQRRVVDASDKMKTYTNRNLLIIQYGYAYQLGEHK